jgi:NADPH-dependent 7-cyano-7-deazaguanine reductase QueF
VSEDLTVPCTSRVTVTATFPLTHRCPYRAETDEGHAEITWSIEGRTLELHTLAAWLDQYADQAISHEDLTEEISERLAALPGIFNVRAVTRWTTAGAQVVVTARALPR